MNGRHSLLSSLSQRNASGSVATSSFTLSTSAGQRVTVDEASSTTYQKGTSSTSASAITTGEGVLVLGTTSGTNITATQVIVQSTGGGGSATSSAAGVIPLQRGASTTSKQVGQIPASYSQGSGTIVGGTTANKATDAALAAYPGGIVDRVVQLSNGEYEVHYIGTTFSSTRTSRSSAPTSRHVEQGSASREGRDRDGSHTMTALAGAGTGSP
jgi:hypothetical protein